MVKTLGCIEFPQLNGVMRSGDRVRKLLYVWLLQTLVALNRLGFAAKFVASDVN